MSPGEEIDVNEMFLTQTSSADYESLCRLDVLGLQDSPTGDQGEIYKEFQEQSGSMRRLDSLARKLERSDLLERYDQVIKDQLEQVIVERAKEIPRRDERIWL
jgi:hypothetical protein